MLNYVVDWSLTKMKNNINNPSLTFSMNKALKVVILLALVLIIPTVIAEPSFFVKQNEINTISLPIQQNDYSSCAACTCTISINYPNGTQFVTNGATIISGGYANYELNENQTTAFGEHSARIECTNSADIGFSTFTYQVTPNGKEITLTSLFANLAILIFFIILIFVFYYTSKRINFEKWYESIIKKYEYRNFIKVILSSIAYNFMKNKFIWYYLFGLPIILVITNTAFIFDVEAMVYLMKIILTIYYFGFLLVSAFFLGYLQEWVVKTFELINNQDRGIE